MDDFDLISTTYDVNGNFTGFNQPQDAPGLFADQSYIATQSPSVNVTPPGSLITSSKETLNNGSSSVLDWLNAGAVNLYQLGNATSSVLNSANNVKQTALNLTAQASQTAQQAKQNIAALAGAKVAAGVQSVSNSIKTHPGYAIAIAGAVALGILVLTHKGK